MNTERDQATIRRIRRVLLFGTLGVYAWSVLANDFINFDDPEYVLTNPEVRAGLTWKGIQWAFTTFYAANWHPLTWLSHMLDCSLFGVEPAGHHLTSLIFHTANTLLLFGVLRRMTGAVWRSALVAALFGWHPLHVESVAWVAERKDVLCAFFGLLSLGAYWRYVSTPATVGDKSSRYHHYGWTLAWFALGLMSKPMLVTFPFLLLLLDFWPLRRISDWGLRLGRDETSDRPDLPQLPLGRLVLEKVPFFLLTLGGCVLTFLAQRTGGAVISTHEISMGDRLANVSVSYIRYLGKTFFPHGLAAFYPFGGSPLLLMVALLLLGVITVLSFMMRQRRPYLLFGWLWFLGMLVPVIGVVQVGSQGMADRYMYLPLIGIAIMVAWTLGEWAVRWPRRQRALETCIGVALAMCLVLTWVQTRYWWSTFKLFLHAEAVSPPNVAVENMLGQAYIDIRHYPDALDHLNRGLRVDPHQPELLFNVGRLNDLQGHTDEAARCYELALKSRPKYPIALVCLADIQTTRNQLREAANHYEQALRINPRQYYAECKLGVVLSRLGDLDRASDHLKAALRLDPNYPEAMEELGDVEVKRGAPEAAQMRYAELLARKPEDSRVHIKLANLLMSRNKFAEAKPHFDEVLRLEPNNFAAHFNLGGVLTAQGQWDQAAGQYAEAARLNSADPECQARLAEVLAKQGKLAESAEASRKSAGLLAQRGRFADAITACRDALKLQPDAPEVLANLAWLLATCPPPELRQGAEAVRLAERAAELGGRGDARFLTPLDAAYAEAGRFDDAIKTAQQAQAAATAANQPALADQAAKRLELYRAGKAYHQPAVEPRN